MGGESKIRMATKHVYPLKAEIGKSYCTILDHRHSYLLIHKGDGVLGEMWYFTLNGLEDCRSEENKRMYGYHTHLCSDRDMQSMGFLPAEQICLT